MKLAPLLGLLLLPLSGVAQDTAYQALRALSAERDQAVLKQVIEVKGRNGSPQPQVWTIVLDDPQARGGVREIEVARGRIVSEKTPVKAYSGVAAKMDFQKLNLDSQGAFTVAEEEARRERISFDSVDYILRREDTANAPIWVLQLTDTTQRGVGTVTIAADTGTVLARDFRGGRGGADREDRPDRERAERQRDERRRGDEDRYERDSGERRNLGQRIERRFRRIGGSLQEFFTGRRTVDRNYRD